MSELITKITIIILVLIGSDRIFRVFLEEMMSDWFVISIWFLIIVPVIYLIWRIDLATAYYKHNK